MRLPAAILTGVSMMVAAARGPGPDAPGRDWPTELIGTVRQWQEFQDLAEGAKANHIAVRDPTKYTLTLRQDGTVTMVACASRIRDSARKSWHRTRLHAADTLRSRWRSQGCPRRLQQCAVGVALPRPGSASRGDLTARRRPRDGRGQRCFWLGFRARIANSRPTGNCEIRHNSPGAHHTARNEAGSCHCPSSY